MYRIRSGEIILLSQLSPQIDNGKLSQTKQDIRRIYDKYIVYRNRYSKLSSHAARG